MPNPSEKVSEGEGVAGYTPGPWKVRRVGLCPSVYGADDRAVVSTGPSRRHVRECRANAFLIAAAPQLAEALQKARNTLAGLGYPKIAADICDSALSRLTPSKE